MMMRMRLNSYWNSFKLLYNLGTDLNVLGKNNWLEIKLIKKLPSNITSRKADTKKNRDQSKGIEYIKKVSLHPRERLNRKKKIKQEPEVQYKKHCRNTLEIDWAEDLKIDQQI